MSHDKSQQLAGQLLPKKATRHFARRVHPQRSHEFIQCPFVVESVETSVSIAGIQRAGVHYSLQHLGNLSLHTLITTVEQSASQNAEECTALAVSLSSKETPDVRWVILCR